MQLAYVILLPDEVHNFMRRVQAELYQRFSGHTRTVALEPHVTVKQPFEAANPDAFERYFDELVGKLEPFEVVMRGYGFFEQPLSVVFLDVEQDRRLKSLRRGVLADLAQLGVEPAMFEDDRPEPHYFHGTLATGLSAEALEEARATLRETPEFRFPLEQLGLFRYTEEVWTLYKRVRLTIRVRTRVGQR